MSIFKTSPSFDNDLELWSCDAAIGDDTIDVSYAEEHELKMVEIVLNKVNMHYEFLKTRIAKDIVNAQPEYQDQLSVEQLAGMLKMTGVNFDDLNGGECFFSVGNDTALYEVVQWINADGTITSSADII